MDDMYISHLLKSGAYHIKGRRYAVCKRCKKLKSLKVLIDKRKGYNDRQTTICMDCEAQLTDKKNKMILALIQYKSDCVPIVIETNNEGFIEALIALENNLDRLMLLLDYFDVKLK